MVGRFWDVVAVVPLVQSKWMNDSDKAMLDAEARRLLPKLRGGAVVGGYRGEHWVDMRIAVIIVVLVVVKG